ncbi:RagB/SusD family nutrient uptake outer membrane protein [Sphingobacterium sp. UBA6320]|uniref:RagB/SusD family nutrient uptake outer membrane protein n=1 Tax=Sphingobacterium sp. UBA6320 TaxID=1947510 RepID=UPI0025EE4A1A|nr:RagB/SusD family nutrient uptake outer membrane protein [Sphingobacterium sp. UBA6320]
MKKYTSIYIINIGFILLLCACSKSFLDQKPDYSQGVPSTLDDCQAMLDDYDRMNGNYSDHGEAAADNYYMSDGLYNSLQDVNNSPENKYNYIWHSLGEHVGEWLRSYQVVYSANLILNTLEKIPATNANYQSIKGGALFFRAFAFYHLAQMFCKPYFPTTAASDPGIPLRLTPDLYEPSIRGTVKQVYERIIKDLEDAILLLPEEVGIKSRPSKAAAYAMLARTYLTIQDYENARKMATESLKLQNTLIDYNLTSSTDLQGTPTATTVTSHPTAASFIRFNAEVIFQAVTAYGTMEEYIVQIHPNLYNSYSSDDRRKTVFFKPDVDWMGRPTGIYRYRGNYDGSNSGRHSPFLFVGLATDEMYLIRAECYARAGNITLAMADLNTLMAKRMVPPYVNRIATSVNDALVQILAERRKELIFRTIRWTDLRRLNQDPQFAVTLHRDMNEIPYTPLQPNDLRYTFLIPTKEVINVTGMEQNLR